MDKRYIFVIILCVSFFAQGSNFSSSSYSFGAAEYLKVPVSAKSAALGGAVCAWKEMLAGTQFNPAIYDAQSNNLINAKGSYSFLTLDRKFIGLDAAMPIGSYIACGISFINYGVSNIEARDSLGNQIGSFNDIENSVTASFAGRFLYNISFGASIRYLYAGMKKNNDALSSYLELNENANGFGLDLGATWEPLSWLCAGASVQNILSYLWWSTGTRDEVLTAVRLGLCGNFFKKSLITEIDFVKTLKQPEEILLGIQYKFLNMFFIRGGIKSAIDLTQLSSRYPDFSAGFGFLYSFLGFDYALIIPDSDLGYIHKISLIFSIGNLFK